MDDRSISRADKLVRCPACTYAFVVRATEEPGAASPTPPAHALPGASLDPTPLRTLAATCKGDGSAVVARVVNTYLATSQKLLSTIRDAVEADDPKAFVSVAHTFKSSSAHLGAQRLSGLCEELESLGRGGSCEGARELVNRISEELECVQEELAAEGFGERAPTDLRDQKSAAPLPEPTVEAKGEFLADAPPPPHTGSATPIGRVALQQQLVSPRDVILEERSRAEPSWRRLIRDPRGAMPWAIGGGVSLVLLVLVKLLWPGPAEPEPRLAAPSPEAAVYRPIPALQPPVSEPAAVADRGASAAAPAPPAAEPDVTTATPPALPASLSHTATPAPAPEVAPEPAAKPQPQAKPATVAKPRTATKPRTAARRAAEAPTQTRATRTPKTRSATSPSSSGRKKAASAQTKPRTTWGGWKVKEEPSTRSRSSQKEVQNGWEIEH